MTAPRWPHALVWLLLLPVAARGGPQPNSYWNVDDVRPGMKGYGRTVMKGTTIERFDAEVLGVLKNVSPGRDLVLCRLAGLRLDHTGVIAGMSGSPVYFNGKLLGAVSYAWAYGKEPIAGVTPFSQMHGFVEAHERRDLVEGGKPRRVGLAAPVWLDGRRFDAVTVADDADPTPAAADGLLMVPLRTPVAATGFTAGALALLRDRFRSAGMVPVQGGGAGATVTDADREAELEPGSPLAVALMTGDFDLSGIGTVTHVEGDRIYGWGHPYMSLGACDLPAMTGFIHTIYPRQSVSFKLGSPLRTVGVVNADVSTCVAGWLGREPDLLPVRMSVRLGPQHAPSVYNVKVVRQRTLLPTLVFTALANSVDMEGDLPDELTAEFRARIEVEGHEPVILQDTYSGAGYSGSRAAQAIYNQVAILVNILGGNTHAPLRITRIDCDTQLSPGRRTAEVEAVELDSETYAPGETLRAAVWVRPYRGARQRLTATLKLPADLPEGSYSATVGDDPAAMRAELRDSPHLSYPMTVEQVFASLRLQTSARRTNLAVRVPLPAVGVVLTEGPLPDLPASAVQILGQTRRTGPQTMGGALVARQATPWVLQGSDTVRFTVSKTKRPATD
jgi:hypothetical protein